MWIPTRDWNRFSVPGIHKPNRYPYPTDNDIGVRLLFFQKFSPKYFSQSGSADTEYSSRVLIVFKSNLLLYI